MMSNVAWPDWNNDGKRDLLVGDWSYTMTQRSHLTESELREMQALRTELAAIDKQVGFTYENWRYKWPAYYQLKEDGTRDRSKPTDLLKQATELQTQLLPYLVKYRSDPRNPDRVHWSHYLKAHGHVWVFLHK